MPTSEALWTALLAMQRQNWEQGVATHAALDDGRRELAELMAADAVVRQDVHGMLGATGDIGLVNSGALGEAVAALAPTDAAAADALERQRWWLLRHSPRHDSGVVYHLGDVPEVWVDSIYMVVPFLVSTRDFAPADMQYRMHREHLWHPESGLYGHRYDVEKGNWVRAAAWASGNGWAAAGIARALHLGGNGTPAEMRGRWQRDTAALIEACAPFADGGRFHDVLDDPDTFTDGTAGLMLAYAVFTGVADGWLDERYTADADAWVSAALEPTTPSGLVRGVCGAPMFDREGTSAEAQAFAIMALAARRRLADRAG